MGHLHMLTLATTRMRPVRRHGSVGRLIGTGVLGAALALGGPGVAWAATAPASTESTAPTPAETPTETSTPAEAPTPTPAPTPTQTATPSQAPDPGPAPVVNARCQSGDGDRLLW